MSRKEISRRMFMQRTAGAAGATLAARSIRLSAEPMSASPRAVAPSDRVRFGIVGVGMEGLHPGGWVVDPTRTRRTNKGTLRNAMGVIVSSPP